MLRDTKAVQGCVIEAVDGDVGRIHDLLFDDVGWVVRYLVVGTGSWLNLRRVLLSPSTVRSVEWSLGRVRVDLTRRQIKDSPDVSTDPPVSRQQEEWLRAYYAWPNYWETMGFGVAMVAPVLPPDINLAPGERAMGAQAHGLRSVRELRGYHLGTSDGRLGHVEDLVVDDGHWAVDHIVANTGGWSSGLHIVVFPDQVRGIDWGQRTVSLALTREQMRNAPDAPAYGKAA